MFDFIVMMLVVAIVGILFALLVKAALDDSRLAQIALFVLICAVVAGAALEEKKAEEIGPCLKYEESVMMVGKVMTPYRRCVERGEWIKK